MDQRAPSTPDDSSAPRWLKTHASALFAAVRRVVPDSLCAYDLGYELSALIGHRWDAFDAHRDHTRMAWAMGLAGDLIARATARGVVPTLERQRHGEPLMRTLTSADLHRLSEMARAPLDLDAEAVEALASVERGAPPAASLSKLDPSHLVSLSSSDARRDA